jgi:hypothetical protein
VKEIVVKTPIRLVLDYITFFLIFASDRREDLFSIALSKLGKKIAGECKGQVLRVQPQS